MVKVWLLPGFTMTFPEGRMDPPISAETAMAYPRRVNVAVAEKSVFMTIEKFAAVLAVLIVAVFEGVPLHPVKTQGETEFAVRVTAVPAG
jgi:hypothetical protein